MREQRIKNWMISMFLPKKLKPEMKMRKRVERVNRVEGVKRVPQEKDM